MAFIGAFLVEALCFCCSLNSSASLLLLATVSGGFSTGFGAPDSSICANFKLDAKAEVLSVALGVDVVDLGLSAGLGIKLGLGFTMGLGFVVLVFMPLFSDSCPSKGSTRIPPATRPPKLCLCVFVVAECASDSTAPAPCCSMELYDDSVRGLG